jgi:hypothetical protein
VTSVSRLPGPGGTTDQVVGAFTVTVSEPLRTNTANTPAVRFGIYNGHTYLAYPTTLTWPQAEAYAQSLGGHLATVNDAGENQWLRTNYADNAYWIGFNDLTNEGTFQWASGESITYSNWAGGYPLGNDPGGAYDFVYLWANNDGRWYNADGPTTRRPSFIEFDNVTDSDGDGLPDVVDWAPADPFNGWDLREAGADGQFDTPDDVRYTVVVSPAYASGTVLSLVIADGPLGSGHYRLRITPSLTDVVGNPLDGNGDGTGGDPFVRFFDVALPAGFVFEGRSNDSLGHAAPLVLAENPPASGLFQTTVFGF